MTRTRSATALALSEEGYAYDELLPLVELSLRSGLSVLLRGHPGLGKSTLAAEVAAAMGLPMEDIRLAQRDPAEIAGVHFPDRERGVLALLPPEWVRRACEVPTFVFLDEVNAAVTRLHQAAAYQIVLEHRVGPHRFHAGTVVMAAGNLEDDHAIVTTLSSALSNRFAHFTMRPDATAWLAWATGAGVDPAILAFVARHGEEVLYEETGDYAFPSPRSWEMASRVYRAAPPELRRRAVAACVGAPAAERLFAFLRIYGRVDPARIVRRGQPMDFRTGAQAEPSFLYAAVFAVAAWLEREGAPTDAQLPNIVHFLRSPGLDPEYLFLFLRELRRNGALFARLKALPEFRALAGELVSLRVALRR